MFAKRPAQTLPHKILLCLVLLLLVPLLAPAQRLRVSDNGHYLVTTDGKPFFYLGTPPGNSSTG
jgi:hypothetical protein